MNPSHTSYELSHAFKTAKVKALIVEPELLPNALKAAKDAGIPHSYIFIFDHHTSVTQPWAHSDDWGGVQSWRTLMNKGENEWVRWDDEKRSKEITAARLFSSGTTGLPKAVEMTHYNFIAQHTMVLEYKPRDYEVRLLEPHQGRTSILTTSRLSASSALQCSTSATYRAPTPARSAAA